MPRTRVNSFALIILDSNYHPDDLDRPARHAAQPVEIMVYKRFVAEIARDKPGDSLLAGFCRK